jgi:hypothetical protein
VVSCVDAIELGCSSAATNDTEAAKDGFVMDVIKELKHQGLV